MSTAAGREVGIPSDGEAELSEIESVHPAWSVIGWRHRLLYDAIDAAPDPMTAEQLFTMVGMGRTSGYEALLDLRVAGLIVVDNTEVSLGPVDLDDIGHRHGLTSTVRARIVRHRAERIVWREWWNPGKRHAHRRSPTRRCS